jgi:preprotein translocase subunit Sec61beta|tara:strand:- start:513 stop:662 length:150 start_codon:yes stop_codon:yes gene_type:complete
MLDNLNKNMKKIIKFVPENLINLSSKTVIYFGLAVYWCVILAGTFFNIV